MATLLDEASGTLVFSQWAAGFVTAELKVMYQRPCPIPGTTLCRTWVEKIQGRKVWIEGVLEDGKGLGYARTQSLFVRFKEKL